MSEPKCPSCGHRDPTHYVGIYGSEPCDDPWHEEQEKNSLR